MNKNEIKEALLIVGPVIKILGIKEKEVTALFKYLDVMKNTYDIESKQAAVMLRTFIKNGKFCDIIK